MSTFSFGFGNDDDGGGGGGAAVATASVVTNSNLAGAAEEVALVARCSEVLPPAACDSEDYDAGVTAMVAGFLCGYKLKAVNPELAENEIAIAAASKAAEASGSPAPARAAAGRVGAEGKSNGGNGSSTVRTSVLKASAKKADLVKGIYEGGMKVWECTHDLVNYMIAADVSFKGGGVRVLELGCGAGLPGIYAWREGGLVDFQDYNVEVLEHITIPNVCLNANEENSFNNIRGGRLDELDDGTVPNGTINGNPQYMIDHGAILDVDNPEEEGGESDDDSESDDDDDDDDDDNDGAGGAADGGACGAGGDRDDCGDNGEPATKRAKLAEDVLDGCDEAQQEQSEPLKRKNEYQPRYFGGGWAELPAYLSADAIKAGHNGTGTYDVILTSETIYSIESCEDLYNALARCVHRPHGVVYVAAKTYYFGVGGGTLSFTGLVQEKGEFNIESVWQSESGVAREILKMTLK